MLRVAVVGPESCGKTTLIDCLHARLSVAGVPAAVVPEYARLYYAERVYRPTARDILAIARGQLAAEQAAMQQHPEVLLCDSTVLTCQIWAEVAYGAAEAALLALNQPRDYDLTLLACPDIPWAPDPLRSHENGRDDLLQRYRAALATAAIDWVEISGEGDMRGRLAWQALQKKIAKLPVF